MLRLIFVLPCVFFAVSCNRDPSVVKKKYLDSGNRYAAAGKYREALIMYRNAINKDPKYGEAYYRQALVEVEYNQAVQSIQSFRRAVELMPESPERNDARVRLADSVLVVLETFRREKQYVAEVERLANDLLERDANSFDGRRIKGLLSTITARVLVARALPGEGRGELDTAIAELRAAHAIRPWRPDVVVPLAKCLWASGQYGDAEKLLLQQIDQRKDATGAYAELARFYRYFRRLDDAGKILKRALENNPESLGFLSDLAEHYQALGNLDDLNRVVERMKAAAKGNPRPYVEAAELYLKLRRPDLAIALYEEGIAAQPNRTAIYRRLIFDALMAQGKRKEAEAIVDRMIADDPKDNDALVRKAAIHFESGQIAKALSELEDLLRKIPDNPVAHYNMGRALGASGQLEPARFRFAEAIRLGPTYIPARVSLMEIELATEEWGKAVRSAEDILSIDPRHFQARLTRAAGLRGLKKFSDARVELNALLQVYPTSGPVLFEMGSLAAMEGKLKEADGLYRRSYQLDPRDIAGLRAIAQIHLLQKQEAQALRVFDEESRKNPNRLDLRMARAEIAQRAGRLDLAAPEYAAILQKVDQESGSAAELHMRLGDVYQRKGDLRSALAHVERARQLRPDNAATHHNLAIVYDQLGRRDEARAAYSASLKISGDNGIALNNLAYHIAELGGDLDQALAFAQRARQKMPHRVEFADTLGWIYFKKGLGREAVEIFDDVVKRSPGNATFRYHLGEALLLAGDKARAKKELQAALSSQPSPDEAGRIRALIAKM
ncbi:MAG: tetratricopeptide repeat protein [Bryobacteraceae bacterium]